MEPLLFSIIHSKFVSYVSEPEQDDLIRQHVLQRIADVNAHVLNQLIARQHLPKRLGKVVKKVFFDGGVAGY
jgi:hypothetical protein